MNWLLSSNVYSWPECAALEINGWRIPTLKEQESIVDYDRINPATALFPNLPLDQFWTATDDAINPGQFRWCVDFMTGSAVKVQASDPREKHHVMLVQGTMVQSWFSTQYGLITDNTLGLMWKTDYEMLDPLHPGTWQDRKDCFTPAQAQARAAADRSGGFSNWRLPTVRELRSLIDESKMRVRVDPDGTQTSYATNAVFPETPFQAWFWSSTPALDIGHNEQTWVVSFDVGVDNGNPRNYAQYVRLVRDCAVAPVDEYTEAEVRQWFANIEKTPQAPGLSYWQVKANGGSKVFYATVKAIAETEREKANNTIGLCNYFLNH